MLPTSINYKKTMLFILFILVAYSQPQTNQSYINHCTYKTKADFKAQASTYHSNQKIQNSINSMFPANKQLMIQGIFQQNSSLILQSVQQYTAAYILHLCIFGLFGLLLLIFIPILCCTDCCGCCCKKQPNYNYTSCQMCWPGVCIIFLLLAVIGLSIGTIFIIINYQTKFDDFSCSLGVMTNDITSGGSYDQNKIKFIGLNNYQAIVESFVSDIGNVNETLKKNLITNSTIMKNISKELTILPILIKKIPSTTGNQLELNYKNPLLSENSTKLQQSTFVTLLGTQNTTNSIVGNLSQAIKQTDFAVKYLANSSDELYSLFKYIPAEQIKKIVKHEVKKFQRLQFQVQNSIGIAQQGILKIYTIVTYVILGVTIFFSTLGCFSMFCTVCLSKFQCIGRYSCCCFFLWLVGIVWFAAGMFFGLANPAVYHGCQYFRQGFKSQQNYQKYIQKIFPGQTKTNQMMKSCLSSSKDQYYFYDNVIPKQIQKNLTALPQAYPAGIPILDISRYLNLTFLHSVATIQDYRSARIIDIQNQDMIDQLRNISQHQACFSDVWVPSLLQQPQIIGCGNKTYKANNSTCKTQREFANRQTGCIGCIDTFQILEDYDSQDQIQKMLNFRYRNCMSNDTQYVVNKLPLAWNNYYLPKIQIIGEVKSNTQRIRPNLTILNSNIQNKADPSYKTTLAWLRTEPMLKYSRNTVLAKYMDCRVLGKAIDNSVNIFCSIGVQYVYMLRLIYYAGALCIFFISCFSICVMNRTKHQIERNSYNRDNKNEGVIEINSKIKQQKKNIPTTQRIQLKNNQEMQVNNYPYFGPYNY